LYTMDQEHLVVLYALDDDNISVMIYNQKGFLSRRLVFFQGQKIYRYHHSVIQYHNWSAGTVPTVLSVLYERIRFLIKS
jgi:hypothetical protein